MIIQQPTPLWKRLALPSGLVAVAIVGYLAWSGHDNDAPRPDQAASATSGGTRATLPSPLDTAPATTQASSADGRPSQVSPEDWAGLLAALARQANGKAEAERIVSYLQFQHDFEFWQSSIDSKNTEQRHQMAQALLAHLPERVAQGEFTGPEGTLMGAVLISDLEADPSKRQEKVDAWTQQLNTAAPQPTDEKQLSERNRLTELKRRQATAYAEWQAKPPGERDQAQLNKAMDDAQRWYSSGAP